MMNMTWEGWAWIAWLVAFGILESIGLFSRNGMTLTFFIQHHLPKWVLSCLLGWMFYHFISAPPALRLPPGK
jgi:hypothetical protein